MKRGLLAVLAAVAAEIALALLAAEFGSAVSSFFYFVPPCLILAGFVWGAVRPRLYADGPAGPHTGCLAGLLVPAFLLFGLVWMGSAFLVWTSEGQIDRSADVYDPAETWKGQWTVEPFVPAGARNFRCEGRCGFGGTVRFSCEVSEQDFLAHAASNNVEEVELGLQSYDKGVFEKLPAVRFHEEDLDIPTYQRRNIRIDKGS